jgi:hypothetical protein
MNATSQQTEFLNEQNAMECKAYQSFETPLRTSHGNVRTLQVIRMLMRPLYFNVCRIGRRRVCRLDGRWVNSRRIWRGRRRERIGLRDACGLATSSTSAFALATRQIRSQRFFNRMKRTLSWIRFYRRANNVVVRSEILCTTKRQT